MRTLSLARAWRAGGGRAAFMTRCANPTLLARIESAGCSVWPVTARGSATELAEAFSRSGRGTWLVVDGYHFGTDYMLSARRRGFKVLAVDDYENRPGLQADIILNQNLGAERRAYSRTQGSELLLGTRYALLRPEFVALRRRSRKFPDFGHRVLVTMGGSDPENATLPVLKALLSLGAPLDITVLLGADNAHERSLKSVAKGRPEVSFVRDTDDMPRMMMEADFAVTAGGSTCWEAACLGLPSLVMVLAENQRDVAARLSEAGAAVSLGDFHDAAEGAIAAAAEALRVDRELRRRLSRAGRALVDGRGAERVAAVMREACGAGVSCS